MILQALHQLAERENLVEDPAFEAKPVAYLIRVADGGRLLGITGTHFIPPQPEGSKKKPRPEPKKFIIPRQAGRSGTKAPAAFLVDNAKYVFGLPTKDKAFSEEEGREKSEMFLAEVEACLAATGDPGVRAVAEFLRQVHADRSCFTLPEQCVSNELFAFIYAPDVDLPVHQRPAVQEYWRGRRQAGGAGGKAGRPEEEFTCLVTGKNASPTKLFPLIRKVPGGSTSGVGLVSFNSPAFESHGWKGNQNAPVSEEAATAAAEALRRLVDPAFPRPGNPDETLPSRRVSLSDDTIACYWSTGQSEFTDCFGELIEADPTAVGEIYHSVWRGIPPEKFDPSPFYALTLTGTQGRAIVRDWLESTVGEVQRNVAQHFRDLAIVRNTSPPKGRELPPAIPLRILLAALAPLGKRNEIPKPLAGQVFRCAISRATYPLSLLQRVLERARAEAGRSDYASRERHDARAALAKAVLIRHYQLELTEMLDPNNTEPGYVLGRLMAVLERMQEAALGREINATIVDRYFGAASATPAVVFPRLIKGARHHASKARGDDRSRPAALALEKQLDMVLNLLEPPFPVYLDLKQQGLFVLGYHHQRAARGAKRETPNELAEDSGTPASATE